ncbi:MAG: hypothetical protein ACXQS2_03620 [Methermicoccaceae archaeon]
MTEVGWIYLGKVGTARRIYLRNCGFDDGDTVIFLNKDGRVYLAKSEEILGVATINSGRLKLPKKIADMLNLKQDDYFGVIEGDNMNVTLSTDMRLVKVRSEVVGGDEGT